MRALVIGYGSIGARHARVLGEIGCEVAVVSRREVDHPHRYRGLSEALADWQPSYVVVANKTSEHHQTLTELVEQGFTGTVLVEKPLFDNVHEMPAHSFAGLYVAYNLRFHPLLQMLYERLQGQRILSVQAYVGQYLPTWRPGTDYRESYSSRRAEGGGVLRDLSHELDYLNWMFGGWQSLTALGGHYSHLEIDSDDVFSVMMVTARCPVVNVQLNYVDRNTRREIVVNTDEFTVKADLIQGTIKVGDEEVNVQPERDITYRAQHQAILTGDVRSLCSLEQGLDVMAMIEAAEKSEQQKVWITK
jgi:predicted dehydrogenase